MKPLSRDLTPGTVIRVPHLMGPDRFKLMARSATNDGWLCFGAEFGTLTLLDVFIDAGYEIVPLEPADDERVSVRRSDLDNLRARLDGTNYVTNLTLFIAAAQTLVDNARPDNQRTTHFRSLTNSTLRLDGSPVPADEALLNISTGVWHGGIEAEIIGGVINCVVNSDGDLVVRSVDGAFITALRAREVKS